MRTDLISQALVIGAVEAAVYWTEEGVRAVRRESDGYVDCSRQAGLLLDSPAEKRLLIQVTRPQLELSLTVWSRCQRLLHWLIAGMDGNLSAETRRAGLRLAASVLAADPDASAFAHARLFGCPLPKSADLEGALRLATDFAAVLAVYRNIADVRTFTEPVSRALRELVYFDFPCDVPAAETYRTLVDRGVVATAVNYVANGDAAGLDELVVRFGSDMELLATYPRLPHLLTAFRQKIRDLVATQAKPGKTKASAELAANSVSSVLPQEDPILRAAQDFLDARRQAKERRSVRLPAADQAKQAVEKQKRFILSLLDKGRLVELEQAVVDLVHNQRRNSLSKHLCMSLCDLGARFTELGQFDLARRVYAAAKLVKPSDVVSLTGYAETLRKTGKFDEALITYETAQARFANDAVCFTGYAETLRDLGRLDEALAVYKDAQGKFADNAVCFNGYAETLRDLGRLDEALAVYKDAQGKFADNAFCFTGYAETLRDLGQAVEALPAYRRVVARFPNNRTARNALACLQLEQNPDFAVEEFLRLDTIRSPHDWWDFHVWAMAKAKRGLWAEAEEMLKQGVRETPFVRQREVFQTSLSFVLLHRRQLDEIESMPAPTSAQILRFPLRAVVNAHASALRQQGEKAERWLEQAQRSRRSQIIVLADYIRHRYGLGRPAETDPHLDRQIDELEFSLILRAA